MFSFWAGEMSCKVYKGPEGARYESRLVLSCLVLSVMYSSHYYLTDLEV